MAVADKLVTIAENEQRVYDAGYVAGDDDGYDRGTLDTQTEYDFWLAFTESGRRTSYSNAFANSDYSGRNIPLALCKPTNVNSMFYGYKGEYLPSGIDLSSVPRGTDNAIHWNMCHRSLLREFPDMNMPAAHTYGYTFYDCWNLRKVEKLRCDANTTWNSAFGNVGGGGCTQLSSLTIEGTIGKNGFIVSASTLLTHDSLMSIINALKDFATYTIVTSSDTPIPIGGKIVDFTFVDGNGTTVKYSDIPADGSQYSIDLFDANNEPFSGYLWAVIDRTCTFNGGGFKPDGDSSWYNITSLTIREDPTTTRTITFGATNLAKLNDVEIATATQKGWSLV